MSQYENYFGNLRNSLTKFTSSFNVNNKYYILKGKAKRISILIEALFWVSGREMIGLVGVVTGGAAWLIDPEE